MLGRTNMARCHNLWLNLRGRSCDFDDCTVATAEALGFVVDRWADVFETIDAAAELVDAAPWPVVSRVAVDVYWDVRGSDRCWAPGTGLDWRTRVERTDDTLFDGDVCRLCRDLPEIPAREHRRIGGVLASGRVSWDEMAAEVRSVEAAVQRTGPTP